MVFECLFLFFLFFDQVEEYRGFVLRAGRRILDLFAKLAKKGVL